jgi:hypothetical protein
VGGEKGPETSAVGEEMSRAASGEPGVGSRKPQASSRKRRAKSQEREVRRRKPEVGSSVLVPETNDKQQTMSNKQQNQTLQTFEHPRAGRSKIRQSGYGNPLKKTPGLFLTRFFADFFIE